eukprot:9800898-Ditylum_brightwellii.AAC.1
MAEYIASSDFSSGQETVIDEVFHIFNELSTQCFCKNPSLYLVTGGPGTELLGTTTVKMAWMGIAAINIIGERNEKVQGRAWG